MTKPKQDSVVIAVDFDGTIAFHEFPQLGAPVPGAIEWLSQWQEAGAKIILWTMRDNDHATGKRYLQEAVDLLMSHGIKLFGVNSNPEQSWSRSPKAYAHAYVDDAAIGCPLKLDVNLCSRPFVDWDIVGPEVMEMINAVKE